MKLTAEFKKIETDSDPKQIACRTLSREDLNVRFARAVLNSRSLLVVKEDVLGEGEGEWDSDPRYPDKTVNCLTWLQLLLSEVYGEGLENRVSVMDRIRYYGGHVAYGLRKHFIDHWLALEPEPLKRVPIDHLPGFRRATVQLDFEHFKSFHQYPCQLYRQDVRRIDVDYLTPEGVMSCADSLEPGHYIAFAAAKESYLQRFGQGSGPMGLVHSLVLKVSKASTSSPASQSDEAVIYHASTRLGMVAEAKLAEYLESMRPVFDGYALFEPDPSWDFSTPIDEDETVRGIKKCESALPRFSDHRRL